MSLEVFLQPQRLVKGLRYAVPKIEASDLNRLLDLTRWPVCKLSWVATILQVPDMQIQHAPSL